MTDQKPISGDFITPVASIPGLNIAALSPENPKDTKAHMRDASKGIKTSKSVLHQVSINLACTTKQLSNIIIWLAGNGSAVKIKVDTS